jgi:hypothetical protein
MRIWLLAFIRAILATGSYVLGASLQIVPGMALRLYLGLGILVAGITFVVEYLTNIRPTRHWREVVPVIIDEITTSFVDFLRDTVGVHPRMHIMIPRRTWRWCWAHRYFVMWWSRGLENQPDVNITFPVGQGVVGECYRQKIPIYAPPEALGEGYRFPGHLRPLIRDLQAIICYPIYEPRQRGRQSGKLIGVLTLDSKTPNAYTLLTSDAHLPGINQRMERIAIVVGQIYY